jgi:hypothetical protein
VNKFSELRRTKAAKTGKKAAPVAFCGTWVCQVQRLTTDFYGHGVTQTEAREVLGTVKLLARTLVLAGQVKDVHGVAEPSSEMLAHSPHAQRPSGSMPSHAATLPLDATTDL